MNDTIDNDVPSYYVGIGASAGGLEAIQSFFRHMPSDSNLAFIVVQHLSPDYKSMMKELLSKSTEMIVNTAEDGMAVKKDRIYLIPPKKNLTIFHGKLLLQDPDNSKGLNLPIDIFLRSLAEDQGSRAIGIILSGTGSDGSRGVNSIKEMGGMVMVQDAESAKFDGMPSSAISTGLADFILSAEDMPKQLLAFVKHPYMARQELTDALLSNEDGLTRIFSLLRSETKVDFTFYKSSTIVRRIERRMTVNQISDLRDYVKYLESYPQELNTLYREMLIGVTNFFRDPEAYNLLRDKWLPALFNSEDKQEVRLWCAGCSTGEEAYSLAILCREAARATNSTADIKIFATDVDQEAIITAGNGFYPGSIAADVPTEYLSRYFQFYNGSYRIKRSIREKVVFASHNILKDPPFSNIDLVSCRNLLIYLQPVLQRKVLDMFNFSINNQGILFLGSSETVGDMGDYFEPLHLKWKLYRSKGKRKMTSAQSMSLFEPKEISNLYRFNERGHIVRRHQEERLLDRFMQTLAGEFAPLAIVANKNLELMHILGDSSDYFKLPSGKVMNDVSRMAIKELSIPLASGLQKVFRNKKDLTYSNIRLDINGKKRNLRLRFKPLPEKKGQEPLAAVFFEEIKATKPKQVKDTLDYDVGKETEQRLIDLEQELQFSRENLQATIEELETSNEELQATNEELLASNEELQSTNQELQSVNEELFTVNAEYQQKIMELTELSNDLDNMLTGTSVGTLFLDASLEIRKFTPHAAEIFSIYKNDIGRPLEHFCHRLSNIDLATSVRRVIEKNQAEDHEVLAANNRWYLLRIIPYDIGQENFSGVVLTLMEINQLVKIREELQEHRERYELAQKAANLGIWDWDVLTGELHWSKSIEPMFGFQPGKFKGTYNAFLDCIHPQDRPRVEEAVRASLDEDKPYSINHRIIWPDRRVHWVSEKGQVIRDSDGRPVRMLGVVQDITMKREMETSLHLFRWAIETSPTPAFRIAKDSKFQYVNTAACKVLGYSKAELQTMTVGEVDPDFDLDAWDAHWEKLKTNRKLRFNTSHITKDRRELPVEVSAGFIEYAGEEYNFAFARYLEAEDEQT